MSTEKTAEEKPRRSWWPFGGASEKTETAETEERGVTAPKGRATPGRRSSGGETSSNPVVRALTTVRDYLVGVNDEVEKVTWPTREDAIRLSIIVIATTVISSLVLGIVAYAFSELFRIGLNNPLIFLAFFVVVLIVGFVIYRRANRPVSGY